jgi:catechol 2,3-dioxygenase-like lactoylglutathione lyase family enzyme
MAISEIHHVGLTVADLERSVAFYRDILGFRKTLDMPLKGSNLERLLLLKPGTKARSVIMQAGRAITGEVELIAFDPPAEQPTGPKRPGNPGVFMLSFEVKGETLAEVHERLRQKGIRFIADPLDLGLPGYGSIKALSFEDPDGIIIELIQLPSLEEAQRVHKASHPAGA